MISTSNCRAIDYLSSGINSWRQAVENVGLKCHLHAANRDVNRSSAALEQTRRHLEERKLRYRKSPDVVSG